MKVSLQTIQKFDAEAIAEALAAQDDRQRKRMAEARAIHRGVSQKKGGR